MLLWWIGNAIFILVVIPVVVLLLQRLLKPAVEIEKHADDILEHAVNTDTALNNVSALIHTRDTVLKVGGGLTRYVTAVDRILG